MQRANDRDERFLVGSRGRPQVVIMGIRDFLATIAPEDPLMNRIRSEARKRKTSGYSMKEIDREITAYRRGKATNGARSRRRS